MHLPRLSFIAALWKRFVSLRPGALGAGILALGLAAQLALFDRSMIAMDEGHLVSAADRLSRGELLYRDVHTGIFPGIYYTAALLFSVIGRDVLVTRAAQILVNTAIALCLFLVGLRVMRPAWAALPPLLYFALFVFGFPVLVMFNYSALSLGFGLAALLFLLRYLETARLVDGAMLGFLLAACVLAKQNFGALVALAVLLGFLWGRAGSPLAARSRLAGLWPIAVSGGAIGFAAVAHFALLGTLSDLVDSTLLDLVGSQLGAFNNPIPPLLGSHPEEGRFTFQYAPPLLFNYLLRGDAFLGHPLSRDLLGMAIRLSYGIPIAVLAAAPGLLWLTRGTGTERERRGARAIVVFAGLLSLGIFPSAIWSHLAYVVPPILLVIALIGDRAEQYFERRGRPIVRIRGLLFGALLVGAIVVCARICGDIRRWHSTPMGMPRASLLVSRDKAELYRGAVRFIEACAGPNDPIFVAPILPLLYFLTDRPNPTPYDLTIPGNVDAHLIVERLEATQTRCIVYDPKMYPEYPPLEEIFPELAHYLSTAYRRARLIRGGRSTWYGLVRLRNAAD
ncbi:hypothetical protein N9166_00440 [bacterium]|nr:hypothetical protein [bacterium]